MNTNMTGFRCFFKNLCISVLCMKVALALEGLTLIMLLVANLANIKWCKNLKITETLTYGYSSESTLQDLSNEYQHDWI